MRGKGSKRYTVLITTSGTGKRLGELTRYTNKSLLKLADKPVISHIIDLYPPDTQYIITLGHFGNLVREYLSLVYPHTPITYVSVVPYTGTGSSLGYSMLQAAGNLTKPFIFHACDTIVTKRPPKPERNWIAVSPGTNTTDYASCIIKNGRVLRMYPKGSHGAYDLHIGLVGVHDVWPFWQKLRELYQKNPNSITLSDVPVIQQLLTDGFVFHAETVPAWYDSGNEDALKKTQQTLHTHVDTLTKPQESVFFINGSVVKFFADKMIVQQRVKRAKALADVVPPIQRSTPHFYQYAFVKGNNYAKIADAPTGTSLLRWSQRYLWKPVHAVSDTQFRQICHNFYYTKTVQRIDRFLSSRCIKDTGWLVNDIPVPPVHDILKHVHFDLLCDADQHTIHGDFIIDNIIKTPQGFKLIDWRQNFGGLLTAGDLMYDLAKLNHSLVVSHQIVRDRAFSLSRTDTVITCNIPRIRRLQQFQKELGKFIQKNGYNPYKITLLTPLIWLNMSPLHHDPFDKFLFYFGAYHLWKAVQNETHSA